MAWAEVDNPARTWRHPLRGFDWIPFVVLFLSVAVSGAAAVYVGWAARAKDQVRFNGQIERSRNNIKRRIDLYVTALRGTAGLFTASPKVDREAFRAYAQRLNLEVTYPGIQGIAFSTRVRGGEEAAFAARMAKEWGRAIPVWPEASGGQRHAVLYIEPESERNLRAIGYDMATDETRRRAMDMACDTGQAAVTDRLELITEEGPGKPPGFLICLPVYRGGVVPPTVAERRAALIGHVLTPFRARELFDDLFGGDAEHLVDLEVFDGARTEAAALLYPSMLPAGHVPRFVDARPVHVQGHLWTLVLRTRPEFEAASGKNFAWLTLVGGLLISGVLFVLTRAEARARSRAEGIATDLERSRQSLLESLEERKLVENARRQLLESEREARREAEAANRIKDDFLATVSHELRTPLNAMLGWAQLLRQGGLGEEGSGEAVEAIERNAQSQAQLIGDLLDSSRIMRGHVQVERTAVRLGDVIDAAVEAMAPSASAAGVEIRRTPDGAELKVLGDATRLQQVVWNLLSNSIKFTPPGGRVDVATERRGAQALIRVSDDGQGIKPEFLPHVFDRFRQADATTTRRKGGLGLGLAIVRSLVDMHGGTVEAHSEGEGRGAAFTVTLPLAEAAVTEKAPAAAGAGAKDAAKVSLEGLRVLVVDDDDDARRLVGKILSRCGAAVSTAASAAEALALFEEQSPDVLLSDIGMPVEDGYGLIAKVRALGPERGGAVPAAALTAFARDEDRERALSAGFQMHVTKPVASTRLVRVVAELAGRVATG
jgi:signal transduction histidine kinase